MKHYDSGRVTESSGTGELIHQFIRELYPICRSITGDGLRQTLGIIKTKIPIQTHEIPTGTTVFDWTIPKEWNIRDAYIKNSNGKKVLDFKQCNLHVVGYSVPVRQKMTLGRLREHLYTLPEHPDWIPFRHSYYKEDWGFCLAHRKLLQLKDDEYEVCINSSLESGSLTLGEYYIEGESDDEVLIYAHTCHPSLCNDNLSGVGLAVFLADWLRSCRRRYSYRFLFAPTTIGSIAWLALHEAEVRRIKHGLILACLGDPGGFTYKKTRRGDAEIDAVVTYTLSTLGKPYQTIDFSPFGYDERQFCSPGFDLPVGCLMRTPNGKYAEYHTSADDLEFIRPEYLADSFRSTVEILKTVESNQRFVNQCPKCEPQLGKRGLFRPAGREHQPPLDQFALLWVLNLSDGHHSLLDIAVRSGLPFTAIKQAADLLQEHELLEPLLTGKQ